MQWIMMNTSSDPTPIIKKGITKVIELNGNPNKNSKQNVVATKINIIVIVIALKALKFWITGNLEKKYMQKKT